MSTAPTFAPELSETDRRVMTQPGWLPPTNFTALEQLREKHEALIATRAAKQAEVTALRQAYAAEDTAAQAALNASYETGADPEPIAATPPEERQERLREAEAHAKAAARAVVSFAAQARERLRGGPLPEDWNPHQRAQALQPPPGGLAAELMSEVQALEGDIETAIREAERTIHEAQLRVRELYPLKVWLARTGNGGMNQMQPGHDLPVPQAYTEMTKPRDMTVPGWWPDTEGEERVIEEGADSGIYEISDPYHHELERQMAARQEG